MVKRHAEMVRAIHLNAYHHDNGVAAAQRNRLGYKRMILRTGILFLLAFSPSWLSAAENVLVFGGGTLSCGKWLESRNDLATYYQLRQWVFGFVSGTNYSAPRKQSNPPDSEAGVAFIDQYCKNNPLHLLVLAAAALVQETGGPNAEHQWKR